LTTVHRLDVTRLFEAPASTPCLDDARLIVLGAQRVDAIEMRLSDLGGIRFARFTNMKPRQCCTLPVLTIPNRPSVFGRTDGRVFFWPAHCVTSCFAPSQAA